ncbi:hypothetical protein KY338_01685 [Candidatus Woesearchaeota archaeon]|nr:hypothetical protein [Candidatus Woesearchaeota archaeon]MBW3005623.1 hypothetical protein [Candidatus Woesearchaeota archaeon]
MKKEKPWYKKWWGILIIVLILFLIVRFYIFIYSEMQKTPEQLELEEIERFQDDVKTSLYFDGVDNDDLVKVEKIEDSKVTELSECIDTNNLLVTIGIDITSKTRGMVDKFVGDDFTWGMNAARTTFKGVYTDYANKEYPEKVGATQLIFVKTPEPTKDKYGNTIQHDPVLIGKIILCHTTAKKINWDGITDKQLESLAIIDWQGTRGTGLADKLQKTADALQQLQSDVQMANEYLKATS